MNNFSLRLQHLTEQQLIAYLSAISALLAGWIIYIQHGWVNDDFVLYHETARLFTIGDFKAGLALYSWPIYSLLIAAVHKLTSLSLQSSANILMVSAFTLTTYSLLRIIQLAGGDKTTMSLGGLLLFSSAYITGDVLAMLLRDPPFWAFTLTSIVCFIQFYRLHQFKYAIFWQITSLLAMLFRIEGATYLTILPFTLLWLPNTPLKRKSKYFIQAHVVNITLSAVVCIALFLHGDITIQKMGRLQELFSTWSAIQANFSQAVITKVNILATTVLGEPMQNYAWFSLILSLVSIGLIKSISVAGWLPALLVGRYYTQIKDTITADTRFILSVVAGLAFINGLLIISKVNILPGRYVIIVGFVMIVFAAFSLRRTLEAWPLKSDKWNKVIVVISVLMLSFSFIMNVLPKKTGYNHEQDAVAYLKKHHIPNNQVFFVTPRSRYYAEAPFTSRSYNHWNYIKKAIKNGAILNYQYLMIPLKNDADSIEKQLFLNKELVNYQVTKTFYSEKKKKKIIIYKKITPN